MIEFRRVVTVLVPAVASSIRDIVRGVADYAAGPNWHLVLHLWGQVSQRDVDSINQGNGIIFESTLGSSAISNPDWKIPAVAVQIPALAKQYPLVTTDYHEVGRRAGAYLMQKGLANLAYLSFSHGDMTEIGFCEKAAESGRAVSTYYVGPRKPELNVNDQRHLLEWLEGLPPPVGILVQSDFLAQKIMDWIPPEWMPDRLALLGVGNDSIICPMTRPTLSSVDRNTHQIGLKAAAILDRMMAGETIPPQAILIEPGEVIERQSTGLRYTPNPVVTRAIRYLEENLSEAPGAQTLCQQLHVSRATLEKHFKETLGCSIWRQRQHLQLERAKYLLRSTNEPMSRIAEFCGFANQQRLAETFRKQIGVPPSHYRAER